MEKPKPLKKLLNIIATELLKKVLDLVLTPYAPWIAASAGSVLVSIPFALDKGPPFLAAVYPAPVWGIVVGAAVLAFLLVVVLRQRVQIGRLKSPPETIFSWRGLDWVLTSQFYANYRHVLLREVSPQFLTSMVRGPFCPGCKRDIAFTAVSSGDCPCGRGFGIKLPTEPTDAHAVVDAFRCEVYVEAQAAARRGEI